jgi:hypothetical protein
MRPPLGSSSHAPAVSTSGRPVRGATGRGDGKPTVEAPVVPPWRRIGRIRRTGRSKGAQGSAAKKQAAVDAAFKRLERARFKPHVLRARPKGPALGRVWTLASLGAPVKRAVAKAQGSEGGHRVGRAMHNHACDPMRAAGVQLPTTPPAIAQDKTTGKFNYDKDGVRVLSNLDDEPRSFKFTLGKSKKAQVRLYGPPLLMPCHLPNEP